MRRESRSRSSSRNQGVRTTSRSRDRSSKLISTEEFYSTYHGHDVRHLHCFEHAMRKKPLLQTKQARNRQRSAIWLAGDSSLDNKHWFPDDKAVAVNMMERVFREPDCCRRDIAWWLNKEIENRGHMDSLFAINTSYEEGKIESRSRGKLLPQDQYLKDNVRSGDYVIVSVGGNDIALFPQLPCTIFNMAILNFCTPQICLDNACGYALPCDDYIWGNSPFFYVYLYFLDINLDPLCASILPLL